MSTDPEAPKIPLPRGWSQYVRSAVLHVISLAQYATIPDLRLTPKREPSLGFHRSARDTSALAWGFLHPGRIIGRLVKNVLTDMSWSTRTNHNDHRKKSP